jgi:hypothetical protein
MLDPRPSQYFDPLDSGGLGDHLTGVPQHLLGDAEQFAIFRLWLGVSLLGRHPLQFLHATRATKVRHLTA